MEYKIAVCDDSSADTNYLLDFLNSWSKSRGIDLDVESFSSAENFLFHYEENKSYDILLLDIEMGRMDGVSLAKKVRRENETVQIIFVTGYSDYIAEGYEVAALHYLMKPVNGDKLFTVLDRAADKLKKNERMLSLDLSGEMVRLPFYEIRYLDVRQNYVTVHAKKDYTVKKTLGEFEAELDDRFYRAGRSFIINLSCIQRVTKSAVFLSTGEEIPLPRGQYEPLNRAIIART